MTDPNQAQPIPSASAPQQPSSTGRQGNIVRPPVVTIAAVLTFLAAAILILGAVLFTIDAEDDRILALGVLGVPSVLLAGLLVWGGLALLRGKSDRIALITALLAIVFAATVPRVWGDKDDGLTFILELLAIFIVLTLFADESKKFFLTRSTKTS